MNELKEQFQQKGFLVIKQALSADEVEHYVKELEKVDSGMKKKSWTIPDGVVKYEAFWPVIFNEKVLGQIKQVLGDDIKFLQHNDLHYGYSSFAWHRDSINRSYGANLPDWQEEDEPYEVVRAGFYLQPEENDFHLGVLAGSHRMSGYLSEEEFLAMDKRLSNTENIKAKIGMKDYLKEKAEWVKTQPGDCIVFDPRLIHTGGEFETQKYSFFVAYGNINRHFKEHYTYYRHLRTDLKYQDIPKALTERLKAEGLYADEVKYFDKIEGAWVPSAAFAFIADFFE